MGPLVPMEPPVVLQTASLTEQPSTSLSSTTAVAASDNQTSFCCGCTRLYKGQPCSSLFTPDYYQEMRDNCAEMTKAELNNIIMGQIMALTNNDDTTRPDAHRHPGKQRERVKTTYYHKAHPICWKTFAYLHGIGNLYSHQQSICVYPTLPQVKIGFRTSANTILAVALPSSSTNQLGKEVTTAYRLPMFA